MTHDKNGNIILCGDIVEIKNAYFKNDCGFWFVEQDGTNEGYCGTGLTLQKIGKTGKISTAKYSIAFWPLSACTNDREKNAAAREHNAQNATIEIVKHINNAAVIDYIKNQIKEINESINYYEMRGYAETFTGSHRKARDYWTKALERLTQPEESPADAPTAPETVATPESVQNTTTAPEAPTEGAQSAETGEAAQTTAGEPQTAPETDGSPETAETAAQDHETTTEAAPGLDNYYIENKETGKIELHFEKSVYMALNDRQKADIKHNFLFSRYSDAWISRCKFPNLYTPRRVAESLGLVNAGAQGERLTFAEQQERKADRAEARAYRMDAKADRAADRAKNLQAPINRMHGDIAFFTQPNINTSAGRAFTRQRERMWAAYDRGMEEFRKSDYYRERAEAARATASQAKAPSKDFCQRRIEDAEKTIRAQKRNISHYESIIHDIETGKNPTMWTRKPYELEAVQKWIEDANDIIEEAAGKIAYYDALIQAQGGIIDPNTLKPGDLVKVKRWGTVKIKSKGPKNFTFFFTESHMTYANGEPMRGKAAYAEIIEKIS